MKAESRNILIIDSNTEKVKTIVGLLEEVCDKPSIHVVNNGSDAFSFLLEKTIDVIILDVVVAVDKCGNNSGLKLVQCIRELDRYLFTPIIFITAIEEAELLAYSILHCFAYVKKPYKTEELRSLFKKALRYKTPRKEKGSIIFRNKGQIFAVEINKMVCIEWLNHKLYILMADGSTIQVSYRTCKEILDEIDADYMIQCSRGIIFNRKYVRGVDISDRKIVLKNNLGKKPIGPTYQESVLRKLGYTK